MRMSEAEIAPPGPVGALPAGTRLSEFEIKGVLGAGGFGIVYLAVDHALEREVAIKEYMPVSMAGRTEALHVSLRSKSDEEIFALGLRSFVSEAKLLARFDHPSLIKVHRFWETNGTAYMAMPVLRGRTLKEIRRLTNRAPDEAWVRATLAPLLDALEQLHREGVYHRDIAPDNIHLDGDGRPVLLDFGAARRVIGGKTQALTAVLKPAYAPIEQYGESAFVKQGPWTDLYALGATLHFMLLGHPPITATARMLANEASELTQQTVPGCSQNLLAIIDWMLAPRPSDRPQSVAELREVLAGRVPLPPRSAAAPPAGARDPSAPAAVTVPLDDIEHADLEFDVGGPHAGPVLVPATGAPGRASRSPAGATPGAEGVGARAPVPGLRPDALAMAADGAHRLPPPARSRLVPLALAGALLASALGYAVWTRVVVPGAGAAGGAAASAASEGRAPEAAASASASAAVATPSPASAVAAAATGAIGATGAASAAASPVEPAAAEGAAVAASAPVVVDAPPPASAREAGTAAAPAMQAPQAASRPNPRTPPPNTANPTQPPAAASPNAQCAGRSPLSNFICMERECSQPRFRNHPECNAWRQQARARDGSSN